MMFPTPKNPPMFRRKERVFKKDHTGKIVRGTVLNPQNYIYTDGSRGVTVRWDHQQPFERGYGETENNLTADDSGEFQFDDRHYTLSWLSHDDIAAIRWALAGDGNADALIVLNKMPKLP